MICAIDVPRRIVLSRKGFDSSAGGCASPILDGRLISLPIPEHDPDKSHLSYGGLRKRKGAEIADLVNQLSKGKVQDSHLLHLDPDLRIELRHEIAANLPLTFGQSGSSQTELRNIDVGDLFLFFGWFREAHRYAERYEFRKNSPDVFVIWGWLQVEERLEIPSDLARAQAVAPHHPHVANYAEREKTTAYMWA